MDMEMSGINYEVYFSFRSSDTRQGFADVLYEHMDRAGIRVFRDEDELAIGDKIDKVLLAINHSQICIPIFSRTFADSPWCLSEVRKMVELKKDVVPIFYDVTPDDVGLKTPAYRELMAEHKNTYGKKKVEDWEDALKAITQFKGWEVLDRSYTKFCKMFIEELLMKLKPRRRYELDNLVGIDNQLDSAMKLLDIGAGAVRYLIIHGMGGIGKTTLAKVVFDKLSASFDGCSFLEDLRESSRRDSQSLDYLRKQLGDTLDPKSATTSNLSRDIRERFYKRKVLIILDDVDTGEQVEKLVRRSWFASGSRIIITTRNLNVLNECGDFSEDSVQSLEMRTLQDDEALQLFTTYAFRKESPPAAYKNLCEEAASTTGGLPLALKVLASLLRGKNERVWRDVIARSRKIPPKEVKNRLKISYDALDHDHQQIFLDLACFFSGTDKSNPCYMWEACDFYPVYGLEVLVAMSLVKITDEKVISMHDQLRDLGRDIVREESIMYPVKRSRLWQPEDALKVLMAKERKEAVEALSLHKRLDSTLTEKQFASFQNIRFLEMAGATVEGNFENLLTKLIWFSWHLCPSSFNICSFYLENLVILDLSYSCIDESWGGWCWIQMVNNLKVLDLWSCLNLTSTPDFSENDSLERLILSGCSNLATIDGSIGKLRSLVHLDLRDCTSLNGLPEQIGSLDALEELFVGGSDGAFSLPAAIGGLKSLQVFMLQDLEITDIPDTTGRLVKLKHLSILRCLVVNELPESVGDLESLTKLDLSWTRISALPDSIGRLESLEELCISGCSDIEELPDTLGNLKSLVNLDLSETSVLSLPVSIGGLRSLLVLNLSQCCCIQELPQSIGELKKLEELNANFCYALEEVPEEIGGLSNLRRLKLAGASVRRVPSTVGQLSLLEELDLDGCRELEELSEVPPNLTTLRVSSRVVQKLPDLSELSGLSILGYPIISHLGSVETKKLEAIQRLTKLKWLGLRLLNVSSIPFDLGSLTQLEGLSLFIMLPEPTSSHPVPDHDRVEIQWPCLSNLRNLSSIRFSCVLTEDGIEALGVRDLEKLDDVWIARCSSKLIEACLVKTLRFLAISGCDFKSMPDLSHLRSLASFEVKYCKELTHIPGIDELESLSQLCVSSCSSLERLGNLSRLRNLSFLQLEDCPRLRCIEGIDGLFVRELLVGGCKSIENMEELKKRCKVGFFEGLRVDNYS